MKEYAAINRLRFNKEEMHHIRQLKSTLKSPTAEESCFAALRMEELDEAILLMRSKGHSGSYNERCRMEPGLQAYPQRKQMRGCLPH